MGLVAIQRRCPFCDSISNINVDEADNKVFLAGTPARAAFLDLDASQIRTIRTGICKACDSVVYEY